MSYKHKKGDLSENPPTLEHLFRGFHGRGVRHKFKSILPIDDFDNAQCLGRSDVIFYLSDKRDPNDPEGDGAQGIRKRFYHTQGPPSYLYVVNVTGSLDSFQEMLIQKCKSKGIAKRAVKPSVSVYPGMGIALLADLEKVDLSVGREKFEISFEGYKLSVMGDMSTLIAFPVHNGQILDADVYIWASEHTRVNWRGVIK